MDLYVIVLRILHIFSGVFWAGTSFLSSGYLGPAVIAAGPEGGKFMQALLGQTRFLRAIAAAAGLATLSGVLLYWRAAGGLRPEWISTGTGLAFTIGGLAGLAASAIGLGVQNRGSRALVAIWRAAQASGAQPTAEQAAQMQAHQRAVAKGGQWTFILLIVALLGMATAQYLSF